MSRKPSHKRSRELAESLGDPFVPYFEEWTGGSRKWRVKRVDGKKIEFLSDRINFSGRHYRMNFKQLMDLHLELLEVPVEKDSVRDFVEKWGLFAKPKNIHGKDLTLDVWRVAALELRIACEISSSITRGSYRQMRSYLDISEQAVTQKEAREGVKGRALVQIRDPETGTKFGRLSHLVSRSDQIGSCGRETLYRMIDRRLSMMVKTRVAWSLRDMKPRIEFHTEEVLGAAWVALYNSVHFGGLAHCAQCKKLMRKGGPGIRRDRLFCSDLCRSKSHREAKKKAENKEKAKKRAKKKTA